MTYKEIERKVAEMAENEFGLELTDLEIQDVCFDAGSNLPLNLDEYHWFDLISLFHDHLSYLKEVREGD